MKTLKALTREIAETTGFDAATSAELARKAHRVMKAARNAVGCIVHEPTRQATQELSKYGVCVTSSKEAGEFLRCLGCWQREGERNIFRA